MESITDLNLIPIKHAINKYRDQTKIGNSNNWIKKDILYRYYDLLLVQKIKNRWYVCNNRLKNINFKLFK